MGTQLRSLRALTLGLATTLALVACGGSPVATPDSFTGSYVVKGGGAPLETFQALANEFTKLHPRVRFDFTDVGSVAGMVLVASGGCDLALSSTEPTSDLRDRVKPVSIGVSGTGVVVSSSNPVAGLTKAQVHDIFSGSLADWSSLGGPSGRIEVFVRQRGSAIRSNFEAYFFAGGGKIPDDAVALNDQDQVLSTVRGLRRSISMITISGQTVSDQTIKLLAIDGVAPTKENLASGSYPVRRPLYLVYEPTSVKPVIRAFVEFAQSPAGQQVIRTAQGF